MTSSRPKALISWSSGKDSAFALHEVRRAGEFDVVEALTTVTETLGRVSIHGVRQEILLAQLDAAGLPPRRGASETSEPGIRNHDCEYRFRAHTKTRVPE